ncbi:conserved Plasmodium protein, unknown function, partial [Plasmodium chabaudi chabaudi]
MNAIMGGHGGLNILPQKKWNVYRKDVQYKVNYDENKLIKEEEAKQREKNKYEFENTITQLKNNISNNNEKKSTTKQKEHINLFAEEEKEITKRNKMHESFLIKKGHYIYNDQNFNGVNCIYDKNSNAKIISDFDKIKNSEKEWFLNIQKKMPFSNNQMQELKNEQRNYDYNKSYNKYDDKFSQKDDIFQKETREHIHINSSSKHIKKDKNKYDHIKELIKYKKKKDKKKKKKK